MKRVFALILVTILIITAFAGCKKEDELYYQYDMNNYITVGSYSKEIDKESEDYGYALDNFYKLTFGENITSKLTEGTVQSGDVANINYKGLHNGEAFSGGTAEGYDLTIGSNQFIPGFEDGLIGAEIGKQINLNLTFPENYHSADLAGKDVVFEVKVNYVTRKIVPTEANVVRYGYKSLADFEKAAEEHAAALCMFYNIYRATTVNSYPEREEETLYNYSIGKYSEHCAQYGATISDLAAANGMTEQDFYQYVRTNEVRPLMENNMIAHYILQTYGSPLTKEDIENKRKALDEKYEESLDAVGYTEISIQSEAAYDKAIEILKKEVKIKK